ncbi:MAG: choice-of-anchor D domain-containing protein [Thermoleophilia bacterium]|nr:choice-of-anchor D domain-containing protein [Thermoleophilia bacterium]
MNNPPAQPKMLGSTILVLFLAAAALIPARALAGPPEGGEGSGTPLVVTPEAVAFPKTTVGNQAPSQEVQLFNKGESTAIDKVSIEGGDGSFYVQSNTCGYLDSGQQCSLWIAFSPSSEGEKEATAEIVFKGERATEAFRISGTGVPPKLGFAPESYDFGLQQINREFVSTSFKVVNNGEGAVALGNSEIGGPGSNAFWTGDSDCWSHWLEPGEACTLEVWFSPHERTIYEAELRINVNGAVFSAVLSGQGGGAVIETPESPVAFGPATVGTEGGVRAITLVNSGDLPAAFFISVIAGGDSGSFELLDENCSAGELVPSGTCTAHVRFTPQGPGLKTARLAFFGDGSDGMMVFLQGEGLAAAVTLLPAAHDFGAQAAGAKSAAHAFAVRNEGQGALELDRAEIVGADLDQFALAGDECSGATLAPGDECLVRVRFTPDSAGAKTAKLRVRGDGGTLASALSGEGEDVPAAEPSTPSTQPTDPAATSAVTVITETRTAWLRKKRRFARGHGIAAGAQLLRRGELRASAARR